MSLMHDALKEMDKPRPDSGGAGAAAASNAASPPRSRQDDTVPPKGMTALDWQAAKFSADARAAADADAYEANYENVRSANRSEGGASAFNITLIAWVLGAVLCAILAALWWVQSRQTQQVVPATEGIAALSPAPKTVPVVQAVVEPLPTPPTPVVSTPSAANEVLVAAPIALAAPIASATTPAAAPMLVTNAAPAPAPKAVSVNAPVVPVFAPPPAIAKAPAVAAVATSVPPITRAQDAPPRPRTAILSTTTLPPPPAVEPAATPNASIESKLANAALVAPTTAAPTPEAPKLPQLTPKQLAAKAAATAAETKRKEAEAQQTANARAAASKNASARFAAIGRALESGNRTAAQNELNSLEQELPASSLTLLRARAWVVGTGSDMTAARGAYAAILARLPDDENALLNMAALEAKDGKMDAARTLLAQALSANPESVAAKAAQQRIATLTAQPR